MLTGGHFCGFQGDLGVRSLQYSPSFTIHSVGGTSCALSSMAVHRLEEIFSVVGPETFWLKKSQREKNAVYFQYKAFDV